MHRQYMQRCFSLSLYDLVTPPDSFAEWHCRILHLHICMSWTGSVEVTGGLRLTPPGSVPVPVGGWAFGGGWVILCRSSAGAYLCVRAAIEMLPRPHAAVAACHDFHVSSAHAGRPFCSYPIAGLGRTSVLRKANLAHGTRRCFFTIMLMLLRNLIYAVMPTMIR